MKKPRNYWKSIDNVIVEVDALKMKHNLPELPSYDELNRLGYSTLAYAISNYHHGMASFRKRIGEGVRRIDNDAYDSQSTLLHDIKQVMRDEGYETLPASNVLVKAGHSRLCHGIYKQGGFRKVRDLLGEQQIKADEKLLQDPMYVIELAYKIKEDEGWYSLPRHEILVEHGYSELVSGAEYLGGMRALRTLIGEEQKEQEKGFWKKRKNCIDFANEIKKKHGWSELPSQSILNAHGYNGFLGGLNNYQGGLIKFAQSIGERTDDVVPGQWRDYDFFKKEVFDFLKAHKRTTIPVYQFFKDHGRHDIVNAAKYHGGIDGLRDKLGQKRNRTKSSDLKDQKVMKERVDEILKKEKWEELPGASTLQEKGYSWLSNAIARHHDGMSNFRKKVLGESSARRENGYYKNWDLARADLMSAIEKIGSFPRQYQLRELQLSSLTAALQKYHGGLNGARQKLIQEGLLASEGIDLEKLLGDYAA